MATYVIVGGVAGGASAAARLRRLDENATIIVLERDRYVSYANCGLPYYVGGVIAQRDSLLVSTPQKLAAEFAIDVRVRHEVLRIDRHSKQVDVRRLDDGGTYTVHYDKLILSPGAKPLVPRLPGVDLPNVFTVRGIPDVDAIKARLGAGGAREAVVVGGGFVGLEMAENLARRGLATTLVEMLDQVLVTLDWEMAALVHRHLRSKGVRLGLGRALQEISVAEGGRLEVGLSSGQRIATDVVVLALGVRPESGLAAQAGLQLAPSGHVVTNEYMQTSDPDIYAVGDAIQVRNRITGVPSAIPLAGPANRQARVAADHITGRLNPYRGSMGVSIVKVFDLAAASTGINSKTLRQLGAPFRTSTTHSADHASYYPGATTQSIKLYYAPGDGKLLGAQVVGRNAVDRTIDVLAVAVMAGMTVFDLEHLELAYAPPFGSAKDPVNVAGYVAANWLRGDSDLVAWDELAGLDPARTGLLDVRSQAEWAQGHIDGAVHIPNVQMRKRMSELSKDKDWVVYCGVGRRAYVMERLLRQKGYRVRNLSGGYTTYQAATEKQDNLD